MLRPRPFQSAVAVFALLAAAMLLPAAAAAVDLAELIRDVEQQYHGTSSHALTTMKVRTANWERTLDLQNHNSSFKEEDFDFSFFEETESRSIYQHKSQQIILDFTGGNDSVIRGKLKFENKSDDSTKCDKL